MITMVLVKYVENIYCLLTVSRQLCLYTSTSSGQGELDPLMDFVFHIQIGHDVSFLPFCTFDFFTLNWAIHSLCQNPINIFH